MKIKNIAGTIKTSIVQIISFSLYVSECDEITFMKNKKLSRRKFINIGIGVGLSQAFGNSILASTAATTVHGACYHDCPDTCSWTVTAVGQTITQFEASKTNPFTAGKLCSKMENFPNDVTFHPDRILKPLKRIGQKGKGEFKPVSWDQAINEISTKLKSIINEKGGEAVLPYSFAGTEGLIQKDSISSRFFARIGATRLERNICGDAAAAGVMVTNGDTTGVLPEDIVHSRYIILWGTNPVVSNQHLWPLILKARQNGAKVVVIDSFQSQSAMVADQHIQPMPGTDVVLALGMINVILSEKLQDQDYINQYTSGFQELKEYVKNYDPESAAKITGLDQATIITLAREYAKASPTLIRVLIGLEKHASGGNAYRAIAMLPAITGAWKYLGGGLMHFTYELFGKALNWERLTLAGKIAKTETRSVNMIQIGRALNHSTNPPIHALFVYNSNPAVIAPDQNQVIKGLKREDLLTVVLEHFVTDTALYADYVLPATSQLEHWDLMESWGQNYINLNQPVISPRGESKSNTEIFRTLARAMDFKEPYFSESDIDIIKHTLNSKHPYMKGITFESLMENGWARLQLPTPWIPHVHGNFATESGKCEFFTKDAAKKNLSPLPEYKPVVYSSAELKKYPLQLMSIKSTSNFLNTSHANVKHLIAKEGTYYLDLHKDDAELRGVVDGDQVRIFNDHGQVLATARIKNKVRQGIVCMPQGFWPSLLKGGSSVNALTNDRLTDIGDGSALQETRVEVSKV
jgi:anaerobic selenocysteine-containing dehydrogenase